MQTLSAFIPMDRRHALARGETLPDRTSGAALLADISGFTPLTAALTQELGPLRGAEELTRQLNHVFGALIAEVHRYGGSVIGFSGDAMTCWFDEATPAAANSSRRATACALAMQQLMTQFQAVNTPAGSTISFQIKIAVTAGSARRFLVGHRRIQRIEVLAGAVLDRMAAAEQQLHQGEVVVGAEVIKWFGNQAHIQAWRADPAGEYYAVVTGLAETVPPAPWPDLPDLDSETARAWLLPPVYQRLQRGEEEFLAELRPAVPLFVKFSGLDYDQDEEAGARLDAYIRWTQTLLARYEGYLLELTMGDKGSYMYAIFGAPLAHEDDPARAVAAALALRSVPPELNFIHDIQIGISQGQMHVGAYGGPRRRTYGVQGNEVNVAARLMSQAEPGQILVTARIAKMASAEYAFRELGPVLLKGLSDPITLFSVEGKQIKQAADLLKHRSLTPMVGRDAEKSFLAQQLCALLDGGNSTIVIEGEAAIGKSRLVGELIAQAELLAVPTLIGAGEAIEQATPYHAWRPVFRQLFSLNEGMDVAAAQSHVLAQLPNAPYLLERLPLLNGVLPLNLPDNDLTAQMAGEVRINNTHELLVNVLSKVPRSNSALLLILEDVHWLDSASWALVTQVRRALPSLLLVLVTRPVEYGSTNGSAVNGALSSDDFKRLLAEPDTQRLKLASLSSPETLALVCRRLGVTSLPPLVADLIQERAEGHPFFSEELALALRDAGLIRIHDGQCTVAAGVKDLHNLNFPMTIQGVITSRIDRLDPAQQLTLKVASVIGRTFAFHSLRDVYPIMADKAVLANHLNTLAQLDITPVERREPELTYIFKHVITQEVAYSLLLFAQRRQLHEAVAEWYERTYHDELDSFYPRLAHHWRQAVATQPARPELVMKAIGYLEKAGEQALRNYANQEAVYFFSEVLALDLSLGAGSSSWQQACWQRQLGEARSSIGQLGEARVHLEQALALMGHPLPATRWQWIARLLAQLMRQAWHRLRPSAAPEPSPAARARLLETARAAKLLAPLYYLLNERGLLFYATLLALNLAERAGPSAELAEVYVTMGAIAGIIPLRSLAETYCQLGLETAYEIDQLGALAFVRSRISVHYLSTGQWPAARETIEQAIKLAQRLGNRNLWGSALSFMIWEAVYQGHFARGAEAAAELYAMAQHDNHALYQAWGLIQQALNVIRLGRIDEALALAEAALALVDEAEIADQTTEALIYGLLASARLYRGELDLAYQAAQATEHLLPSSGRTPYSALDSYASVAEVYLALWEQGQRSGSDARRACQALRRFAGVYPIGRPRAWLYQGLYEWLAGKPAKAQRAWQKSLLTAGQLGMCYDQGRAHYEIGRHLPATDPARREHLQRAADIFAQSGAVADLASVHPIREK